jgi:hypothetical protein
MFRLNRQVKLKNGELLTPYLVDGESVYCMTQSKKTVIRNVKEFDFTATIKSSVIMVAPIQEVHESPPIQKIFVPIPKEKIMELAKKIPQEEVIVAQSIPIVVKPLPKKAVELDSLVVMKGKVVNKNITEEKKMIDSSILKNEEYI